MARYRARGPEAVKRAERKYWERTKESRREARNENLRRWRSTHPAGQREVARTRAYRETVRGRARKLLNAAKANAAGRGLPFALTADAVLKLLEAALAEGAVTLETNQHNTASLDRLVPGLGYVPGNVQVIPWWLNAAYNRFPKSVVNEAMAKMAGRLPRL